ARAHAPRPPALAPLHDRGGRAPPQGPRVREGLAPARHAPRGDGAGLRRGPPDGPRAARRRRARPRLPRHPRAPRGAGAGAGALPGRRRPGRRALGRRGAPGPRPPAPLGRPALPARVDGDLRRRGPARPARHRLRDALHPRDLEVPRDHRRAARLGPRRPSREARPRGRAGGRGRHRRRGAQRGRPPDRRDAARPAHGGRPAPAARGATGRGDRAPVVPGVRRRGARGRLSARLGALARRARLV
ncbi:MAG: hypothetical protein AVDCRST_MAG30-3112, partial [uncultured Solirubrobacteraceae bacterium]